MPTWTTPDTIMASIGIGFGLMMTIVGLMEPMYMITTGSGIGLIMATILVSFMYNRNMKHLNTILGYDKKETNRYE